MDVGIYFFPEFRHPVEFEENRFYPGEDQIWIDLEHLLKKNVDLIVLNRVPAPLASSAIRGIPLFIKDWGLYLDFSLVVTDEAENIMGFFIDAYLGDQFETRSSIPLD